MSFQGEGKQTLGYGPHLINVGSQNEKRKSRHKGHVLYQAKDQGSVFMWIRAKVQSEPSVRRQKPNGGGATGEVQRK